MTRRATLTAVILTASVLIFSSISFAGNNDDQKKSSEVEAVFSQSAIENLKIGIVSDNAGLRKSSIYFAGIYEIDEAVTPLVFQMQKEKDSKIKILIALALYKIGNEEGLKAVKDLAYNDKDLQVKRMGKAILHEFAVDSSKTVSSAE